MVDAETLEGEGDVETPIESTTEEVDVEELKKKALAYEAQKVRAEKAEKALKKYMSNPPEQVGSSVDPVELVRLGKKLQDYSDDELDLGVTLAKSKKPEDILKAFENPIVQAGIKAQREKVEKEKGLKPSGTQTESEKPKELREQLNSMSMKEKEEFLEKIGAYRSPRPRSDSRKIG